jgi:hypothetical protein
VSCWKIIQQDKRKRCNLGILSKTPPEADLSKLWNNKSKNNPERLELLNLFLPTPSPAVYILLAIFISNNSKVFYTNADK